MLTRKKPLRSKAPLKRSGPMKPRNNRRKRKAEARNFGEEAGAVRGMPCLACRDEQRMAPPTLAGYWGAKQKTPTQAAHVTARGMGAVKGGRFDLVPLCDRHHAEAGEAETSQRAAFEERYGLNLRAEADRIAVEHPEPRGIRGVAAEVVAVFESMETLRGWDDCKGLPPTSLSQALEGVGAYERGALLGWIERHLARRRAENWTYTEAMAELCELLGLTSEQARDLYEAVYPNARPT